MAERGWGEWRRAAERWLVGWLAGWFSISLVPLEPTLQFGRSLALRCVEPLEPRSPAWLEPRSPRRLEPLEPRSPVWLEPRSPWRVLPLESHSRGALLSAMNRNNDVSPSAPRDTSPTLRDSILVVRVPSPFCRGFGRPAPSGSSLGSGGFHWASFAPLPQRLRLFAQR